MAVACFKFMLGACLLCAVPACVCLPGRLTSLLGGPPTAPAGSHMHVRRDLRSPMPASGSYPLETFTFLVVFCL